MTRNELYKKMFEAAISEAGISDPALTAIKDDVDLYKFPTAYASFETNLSADKSYLKEFVKAIAEHSQNDDMDDDVNSVYTASLHEVEPCRKIHLHNLCSVSSYAMVLTSECLYEKNKGGTLNDCWNIVEKIWFHIDTGDLNKNAFFKFLKNKEKTHYYIFKVTSVASDAWRVYSEAYFRKAINETIPIPDELNFPDSPIEPMILPDWTSPYEQYHDSFNIIADMKRSNDLLTRFLKMYQVLELFTFRLKLVPLAQGQATRNSFVSNVRNTVNNLNELDSLKELFKDVFKDIHKTDVKDDIDPPQAVSIALGQYINGKLTAISKKILDVNTISDESTLAKLVYKIRCCIVHSKESEMHFTPDNIEEYKEMIPVMTILIKVIQKEIVIIINDHKRNKLEFADNKMMLY